MSRTKKDRPFRVTGIWTHRYLISSRGHAKFTKSCRKRLRAKQKNDLCRYGESMPDYSISHEYYD